jgi:dihydroorotase
LDPKVSQQKNGERMKRILIYNASIINEGRTFLGSVLLESGFISKIFTQDVPATVLESSLLVDASGKFLLPGAIDIHVHFRDPGLTYKADMESESRAAVAGGVTSFLEMPNTKPMTVTLDAWKEKMDLAASKSLANYGFYLGATNDNLNELLKADYSKVCGVKLFMGSSTGNMLVGQLESLEGIFKAVQGIVAVHAESESVIQANKARFIQEVGADLPIEYHSKIRSAEACYQSTALAIELATRWNTRLHIAHVSTAGELALFGSGSVAGKRITAEVCVPHLWFDDRDYARLGNRIKCNPAIKSQADKDALRDALKANLLDVVATDHAPHTLEDKIGNCLVAASGMPSVQFSLILMLEMAYSGIFSKELIVEKMCHAPAILFNMDKRGFVREGYHADLALVDMDTDWTLQPEDIVSKCGWSPFEQQRYHSRVISTWVNGEQVYDRGSITQSRAAQPLRYNV